MERIRPPGWSGSDIPQFDCTSIHDLLTNRDFLVAETVYWGSNEARGLAKFPYAAYKLAERIDGKKSDIIIGHVFIPKVRHIPREDPEDSKRFTIHDFTGSLDLRCPDRLTLSLMNRERRDEGLKPLTIADIKETSWLADVHIRYVSDGASDRLVLEYLHEETMSEREEITVFDGSLIPNPSLF